METQEGGPGKSHDMQVPTLVDPLAARDWPREGFMYGDAYISSGLLQLRYSHSSRLPAQVRPSTLLLKLRCVSFAAHGDPPFAQRASMPPFLLPKLDRRTFDLLPHTIRSAVY